jgi:hypothetical protein
MSHATPARASSDPGRRSMIGTLILAGYGVVAVATLILFSLSTRHREATLLVAWVGWLAWTFGLLAWVVLFDSRRRWPKASVARRFLDVITFRPD